MDKEELSDISYVSDDDLDILDSINNKSCPLVYSDVLDAFNDNLAKNPDNPLVSYKDVSYSYGQGAFVADKIAKTLIDMGIEPQENVAFLVDCSELYMFSVLGILSTGAVYVPLDTAHPDERIGFMIEDTGSNVVLVSDETCTRAKGIVDDSVVLLNISDIVKEDVGTLDRLPVVYGNLACMLYTSGSTGLPKGVKITSLKNGNTIFLPATGYMLEDKSHGEKKLGRYWASDLYEPWCYYAWTLEFDFKNNGGILGNVEAEMIYVFRWAAQAVRPVLDLK